MREVPLGDGLAFWVRLQPSGAMTKQLLNLVVADANEEDFFSVLGHQRQRRWIEHPDVLGKGSHEKVGVDSSELRGGACRLTRPCADDL